MSKKPAKITVTFFELMDGTIAVQKNDQFFVAPQEAAATIKKSPTMRNDIALQFDSAPFKTNAVNIVGATIIDRVDVAA